MTYYYVARVYSHTDTRYLWSIVSRRMINEADAEAWAEHMAELEPKREFFVISKKG